MHFIPAFLAAASAFLVSSVSAAPVEERQIPGFGTLPGPGTYNVKNLGTGECLGVASLTLPGTGGGTPIVLSSCSGNPSQLWTLAFHSDVNSYTWTVGNRGYAGFGNQDSNYTPGYQMLVLSSQPYYITPFQFIDNYVLFAGATGTSALSAYDENLIFGTPVIHTTENPSDLNQIWQFIPA